MLTDFLERMGAEVVECACVIGLPEVKVMLQPSSLLFTDDSRVNNVIIIDNDFDLVSKHLISFRVSADSTESRFIFLWSHGR